MLMHTLKLTLTLTCTQKKPFEKEIRGIIFAFDVLYEKRFVFCI